MSAVRKLVVLGTGMALFGLVSCLSGWAYLKGHHQRPAKRHAPTRVTAKRVAVAPPAVTPPAGYQPPAFEPRTAGERALLEAARQSGKGIVRCGIPDAHTLVGPDGTGDWHTLHDNVLTVAVGRPYGSLRIDSTHYLPPPAERAANEPPKDSSAWRHGQWRVYEMDYVDAFPGTLGRCTVRDAYGGGEIALQLTDPDGTPVPRARTRTSYAFEDGSGGYFTHKVTLGQPALLVARDPNGHEAVGWVDEAEIGLIAELTMLPAPQFPPQAVDDQTALTRVLDEDALDDEARAYIAHWLDFPALMQKQVEQARAEFEASRAADAAALEAELTEALAGAGTGDGEAVE